MTCLSADRINGALHAFLQKNGNGARLQEMVTKAYRVEKATGFREKMKLAEGKRRAELQQARAEALAAGAKAVKKMRENADTYSDFGFGKEALFQMERIFAAEKQAGEAENYAIRGRARAVAGDYEGALLDADKAVSLDDRNIYNFDPQGRLLEMRKAAFGDEEGQPVDEQTISSNVNALLKEYYPDWLESECDIRIEKNENARPPWSAYVIRSNDDLTKEHLLITFEMTGSVKAVIRSGGQESIGSISKAEAVQIALEELRSGKYGVPDFNVDDIDIIVEVRKRDNEKYYFIAIKNIIVDEIITTGYYMEINAYTGKIEKIKN